MNRPTLRRALAAPTFLVLVLALAPAPAAARPKQTAAGTEVLASLPDLAAALLRGLLVRLTAAEGTDIDPNGAPTAATPGDEGTDIDPDGADSPGDEGSDIDPNGRH